MKKSAKRAKAKSRAQGTRAAPSTRRTKASVKGRKSSKAKRPAARATPKSRPKLKKIVKNAATAALVAGGLAAVQATLGALDSGKKAAAEPASDDTEKTG
jgi:hypothetical protein